MNIWALKRLKWLLGDADLPAQLSSMWLVLMSNCGCGTKHKYCTVFLLPSRHVLLPLTSCKLTVVSLYQVWKCVCQLVWDLRLCEEPYRQICEVSTKPQFSDSCIFLRNEKKSYTILSNKKHEIKSPQSLNLWNIKILNIKICGKKKKNSNQLNIIIMFIQKISLIRILFAEIIYWKYVYNLTSCNISCSLLHRFQVLPTWCTKHKKTSVTSFLHIIH